MNILIVIATNKELELVKELGYDGLPVLITGVGAIHTIDALKDIPKDTTIFNIGYAGSNNIPIGKIVEVDVSTVYHENVEYEAGRYNLVHDDINYITCYTSADKSRIVCYTSTDFVTHTNITEPCVFDMELAFICSLGFENVYSFKKVSDNLSVDQYEKMIK